MDKIVVPGEEVPVDVMYNTIKLDGKSYATTLSLLRDKRLIPLTSVYTPKRNDTIVGIIADKRRKTYFINFDYAHDGYLGSDREYKRYDVVMCKIDEVNETKQVSLGYERLLMGGELIRTPPSKVARIIGKVGSMLKLIQSLTGCEIQVGQNGLVWIKGKETKKVKEVIKLIEKEAHLPGLTDKVKAFLEKK